MSSLKSDLISFPAFEHCHNKPSRPGSLKSRACYTQLSPGPGPLSFLQVCLPSLQSHLQRPECQHLGKGEATHTRNTAQGLTDQPTLSRYKLDTKKGICMLQPLTLVTGKDRVPQPPQRDYQVTKALIVSLAQA